MSAAALGDATALRDALLAGELGVREALEASLERVARLDGELGAFAEVEAERARARADELDRARAAGAAGGALFGVPVALKSNLCAEGFVTDCGSRILAGYRAPYTATAVARLLAAGAVPVGTTHMDEFAMGSSGENSSRRATRNPWDLARSPGGSSSGSAAAVAARLVPLALGSDTGGSVRQPAAFCGIVGFLPTWGHVSRHGLVAYASSLDQIGPLATSVRDARLALSVVAGADALDATSFDEPLAPAAEAPGLAGRRIGVPREALDEALEPGLRAVLEAALARIEELGASLVEVRLPHLRFAIPTYYVLAMAEASSNLARFDGVRYGRRAPEAGGPEGGAGGDDGLEAMMAAAREAGFGPEVQRRILLGTYVLSSGYHEAWYGRATRVRRRIRADFARAFEEVDLLAGPTTPGTAFPLGERAGDPLAMYLSDVLTVPVNLAGLPACSVPCGLADGLPVGLQLVGPARGDAAVLDAAAAFEAATPEARVAPPLAWARGGTA